MVRDLGRGKGSCVRQSLRIAGALLLVFACGFAFVALTFRAEEWVRESPAFALRAMEISGQRTLSAEEVRALYPVGPGTPLIDIDVRSVGRAIEAHPRILRATVQRRFPDVLRVHVVERVPVAQVYLGRWYEIDASAVVLGAVRASFESRLPRFFGVRGQAPPVAGTVLADAVTPQLVALVEALGEPPLMDQEWSRELAVFWVSEDGGLSIPLDSSSATLVLGREAWIERLTKLAVVQPGGWDPEVGPRLVDLRFENQVVVGPVPGWSQELARAD